MVPPPSTRKDGTYRWLNDLPIADAPLRLIQLARKSQSVVNARSRPRPCRWL